MNFYPVIKCNGKKLYGSSSHLLNASFIEFISADNAFVKYVSTQNADEIDTIIAILYRPKKNFLEILLEKYDLFGREFSSDYRKRFNSDSLRERINAIKSLNPDIKSAIIDYFNDCRLFIIKHPNHAHLFVESKNASTQSSGGWFRVLDSTSGAAFGDFITTAHTNVYTVFNHLNNIMQQRKEAERNSKK